jgi:hypothetical protein
MTTAAKRGHIWQGIAGVGALIAIVLAVLSAMDWGMSSMPANLDFSTTRTSTNGVFRAAIRPAVNPIPINTLHSWTLHVETPDGKPIENAMITLHGDMPQHGHGMPTTPVVSSYLGQGNYAVDGMKFQMAGWWVVDFDLTAGDMTDQVRFNLLLK